MPETHTRDERKADTEDRKVRTDRNAATDDEVRPFVWLDAGHVPNAGNVGALPDDVRIQHGKVAVDAGSGLVLDEQPDYPEHEVPEPAPPEPPEQPEPEPASKGRS